MLRVTLELALMQVLLVLHRQHHGRVKMARMATQELLVLQAMQVLVLLRVELVALPLQLGQED